MLKQSAAAAVEAQALSELEIECCTLSVDDLGREIDIYRTAINSMTQGLCLYDADQRVVVANRRFAELYGLTMDQVRPGRTLREVVTFRVENGIFGEGDPEAYFRERVAPVTKPVDKTQRLNDGRTILIRQRPLSCGGWVTTHDDITDRCRAEARIEHMAMHDALTDLANRAQLTARLEQMLRNCGEGRSVAVHWLDLDRFKNVNDLHGHAAGDGVLKEVGARLRSCVRDGDVVARIGGDEFAVLQSNVRDARDASSLAHRILDCVTRPARVEGNLHMIGTSIGIALASSAEVAPDELLRNADFALYRAKNDGRGTVRFFEPAMNEEIIAAHKLDNDLRFALIGGRFELYYQPIMDLDRHRVASFEALIRWHHPTRGLVSPMDFIPAAERNGLIVPIGEWVIRKACEDAATWPTDVSVAVNLSPAQFKSGSLLESIENALAASGLAAGRLELEITESLLIEDPQTTTRLLREIKALGVRISMDDFGTGHSSLSYLSSFPFDKIKIDRSFIKDLPGRNESFAILRAITSLGQALGMTTTAEGVETQSQLDIAVEEGCSQVQGYFFSPPRPASEVPALLEQCGEKAAARPKSHLQAIRQVC